MYIYIRAMSESQSRIYEHLTSVSRPIMQHIIRLCLFPADKNVNHWKKEIMSFLYDIDKLKGKNRWPSAKFIKTALSTHLDNLSAHINYVVDIESELTPERVDEDHIRHAIESYFSWISDQLSKQGSVRAAEIYNQLNEL